MSNHSSLLAMSCAREFRERDRKTSFIALGLYPDIRPFNFLFLIPYELSFIRCTLPRPGTQRHLYVPDPAQDRGAKPSDCRCVFHSPGQRTIRGIGEKNGRPKARHSHHPRVPLPAMVLPGGGKTRKIQFFDKISTCKGTHCSLLMYLCTVFQNSVTPQ